MSHNFKKHKKEDSLESIFADIFYHCVFADTLSKDDLKRFKLCGIELQENNLFSLKVALNLGELKLSGLKSLQEILELYSSSFDISTKQEIILKDIKLQDLPKVFNILQSANFSIYFDTGYSIKRVLTCPVNGVDKTQIYDVEELVNRLNSTFLENKNFFNLPSALQITISGYEEGCDIGFTPDISFNATKNQKDKVVFAIKILNTCIGYINAYQIVNTTRAIASLYRDFGLRNANSSFENFIKETTLSKFFDILTSMLDFTIANSCFVSGVKIPKKPRLGINDSKKDGFSYIGCKFESKNINKDTLKALIKSLEENGASRLKLTYKANIIILDVPTQNASTLLSSLRTIGFE